MKYLVISYIDRCGDWYGDHHIESFDSEEDVIAHVANLNASKDPWNKYDWEHWIFDKDDFKEGFSVADNGKYYGENFNFGERIAKLEEQIKAGQKAEAEAKKERKKQADANKKRKKELEQLAALKAKYECEVCQGTGEVMVDQHPNGAPVMEDCSCQQ
tara:strand:- start:11386 stop:11859 length:474 start_codon:yes stop_codon:yes gene_type:complete